jgi:hypothetical protein
MKTTKKTIMHGFSYIAGILFLTGLLFLASSCDMLRTLNGSDSRTSAAAGGGNQDLTGNTGTDPSGALCVTFNISLAGSSGQNAGTAARNAAGATDSQIRGSTLRNYYELVAIDQSEPGKIWDFDRAGGFGATGSLAVVMKAQPNHSYYILILGGWEDDWTGAGDTTHLLNPTLLTSGYTTQAITKDSQVIVPMYPIVNNVQFTNDTNGAIAPVEGAAGATAQLPPLPAGNTWTCSFKIGSQADNSGVVTGDGLMALKMGEFALAGGGNVMNPDSSTITIKQGEADFFEADSTVTSPTTGGYITYPAGYKAPTGTTRQTVFTTATTTTGSDISLTLPQEAFGTSYVIYNLTYNAFGRTAGTGDGKLDWTTNSANFYTKQTSPTDWTIRNGLNNDVQTDSSNFSRPALAQGGVRVMRLVQITDLALAGTTTALTSGQDFSLLQSDDMLPAPYYTPVAAGGITYYYTKNVPVNALNSTLAAAAHYSGTVAWQVWNGSAFVPMTSPTFEPRTQYQAVVSITADPGYVFGDLPTGPVAFTHSGASSTPTVVHSDWTHCTVTVPFTGYTVRDPDLHNVWGLSGSAYFQGAFVGQ